MVRRLLICALAVAAGCRRPQAPRARPPDLLVLYSGDLRGIIAAPPAVQGGLARRATLVDRARLAVPPVVQVDAGDLTPGPEDAPAFADPSAREQQARLLLSAYRRMGVDAITVGERELALGASRWRALCDQAEVPVVAANLTGADGHPLFPSVRMVQAGGVAIGVFGLFEVTAGGWAPPPGVTVTDPSAAAQAAVAALRARGARVVVGLFHLTGGLARAREIAGAAGAVDLVVLGHAGPPAPPRFVRAAGVELGRAEVRLVGSANALIEDHLSPVGADVPEQTGVRLLARLAAGPVAATFAESVAKLSKATGGRQYGESWTYGSTPLCVGCHPAQAAQWRTTDHAHAYATLTSAGKAREPACMGCHVSGFLQPGGAQNLESAAQFADVGCESCHGPSVAHVTSTDKRKGTSRHVDPVICLGCHTPDQNIGRFDLAAAMKEVVGPGHGTPGARPN